ncbi:MAG: T9SS type A sorting domain-containing protein, partial [Bacteroidota bacterium]
ASACRYDSKTSRTTCNSALNFDTKASGTGPSSLEVRLIIDGNTESIGTATTTSSFKAVAFIPNQIPTVTSSTACFRIIATGASSSTGTLQIDNLNVEGSVLPIELNYFRATTEEDIVNVLWQTATETNNDYMEVQRSRDGQNFAAIGTVTGAGTTSEVQDYSFTDNEPLAGVSYYRLQQFDYDGASEIHQTITVYRSTTDWNIQTVPSAVTQQLSIFSSEVLETPATYEIFTMDGRLVQRGVMQENTATMRLDVSQLAKGNHILVMKTTSNSTVTRFSKL